MIPSPARSGCLAKSHSARLGVLVGPSIVAVNAPTLAAEKTLSISAMVILKAMSFLFIGFSLLVHDVEGCGVQLGTPPPAVFLERSGGCDGMSGYRETGIVDHWPSHARCTRQSVA